MKTPQQIARSIIMDSEGRYTSDGCEERIAEAIQAERDSFQVERNSLQEQLASLEQALSTIACDHDESCYHADFAAEALALKKP